MSIILKPVWFVMFLVLAAANLIATIGMKLIEKVFGIFILIMLLGGIMSVVNQCWDSFKCVGLISGAGFAALFIAVVAQVFLEEWRDCVREKLFSRG